MNLKTLIGAGAAVLTAGVLSAAPAQAAPISLESQLDIVGIANVDNSTFAPGGFLDFQPNTGTAIIASGDFAALMGQTIDLFDLNFTGSELVYTGPGGLSFTANNFHGFDNDASDGGRGFMADGIITLDGFDPTRGVFSFSTQENRPDQIIASFSSTTTPIPLPASVLMLLAALGGLGVVSRRRSATA